MRGPPPGGCTATRHPCALPAWHLWWAFETRPAGPVPLRRSTSVARLPEAAGGPGGHCVVSVTQQQRPCRLHRAQVRYPQHPDSSHTHAPAHRGRARAQACEPVADQLKKRDLHVLRLFERGKVGRMASGRSGVPARRRSLCHPQGSRVAPQEFHGLLALNPPPGEQPSARSKKTGGKRRHD